MDQENRLQELIGMCEKTLFYDEWLISCPSLAVFNSLIHYREKLKKIGREKKAQRLTLIARDKKYSVETNKPPLRVKYGNVAKNLRK